MSIVTIFALRKIFGFEIATLWTETDEIRHPTDEDGKSQRGFGLCNPGIPELQKTF